MTIPIPSGTRFWLATGHTDMRKGFDGLAVLVQETLRRDPHNGHLFVFRGRRGALIKVLWHDGQGMCLFAKRLERGRFISLMAFVNPLDTLPLVRCDAADQDFKRNPQRSGRRGLSTVAQPLIRGLIPHDDDASEGWLVLAADVGLIVARPK